MKNHVHVNHTHAECDRCPRADSHVHYISEYRVFLCPKCKHALEEEKRSGVRPGFHDLK